MNPPHTLGVFPVKKQPIHRSCYHDWVRMHLGVGPAPSSQTVESLLRTHLPAKPARKMFSGWLWHFSNFYMLENIFW
jgi:hypothetical protein